jgi:hypothetical protein
MPLGKRTDYGDSRFAGLEVDLAADIVATLKARIPADARRGQKGGARDARTPPPPPPLAHAARPLSPHVDNAGCAAVRLRLPGGAAGGGPLGAAAGAGAGAGRGAAAALRAL